MEQLLGNLPAGGDVWRLGDAELLTVWQEVEAVKRAIEYREMVVLAELQRRGGAALRGYRSVSGLIGGVSARSRGHGNRVLRRCAAVQAMPVVGSALAAGDITVEHVDVIEEFRKSLSSAVHPDLWEEGEQILVDYAKTAVPAAVKRVAESELRLRLDPDGVLPSEAELAEPRNSFHLAFGKDHAVLSGRLDLETATLLQARLDPIAKPTAQDRTSPQRYGAALRDLIHTITNHELASEGGEPPQVLVRVDLDTLVSGVGSATIGPNNQPITASEARRIACDARIVPLVIGGRSEPLDIGRASRTVSTPIRRAVADRDQGCAFPGCEKPPPFCQVHHLVEWQHGGETNTDNLALLCRQHHRLIHHSDWQVQMNNGRPEFIPPAYLDPARRPRTNRLAAPAESVRMCG